MKRLAILGTFAILAATPASIGLIGNASFSQSVPVRVPAEATLLDDGGHTAKPEDGSRGNAESGDDHGGDRDRSGRVESGDDDGGDRDRSGRVESGDDDGGDRGRGGGDDDSGSDDHGSDDRSGRGGGDDDSGSDDHGSGGHGSDDGPDHS